MELYFMKNRCSFLSTIGLAALMSAAVAFAAPAPGAEASAEAKAKVGEAAPNFTLDDANGKSHSLSDYKGKIVILQWINPDCPICRRVSKAGLVTKMAKECKALNKDIVHLAINSTAGMPGSTSAKYLKKHKIKALALIDGDGKVGHRYGARTTPHIFVIDAEGILRYQGAIDDDPRGGKEDATNYVVNAVRQISSGETVSPDYVKSYGCSVKYAD